MRGALHELLHVVDPVEVSLNGLFVVRLQAHLVAELLGIVAIAIYRGHAAGGGMWLRQQSGFGQVCHHVADGRSAQPLAVVPSQRARADRLTGRDVGLDDGRQNLLLTSADAGHCEYLTTSLAAVFLQERLSQLDASAESAMPGWMPVPAWGTASSLAKSAQVCDILSAAGRAPHGSGTSLGIVLK